MADVRSTYYMTKEVANILESNCLIYSEKGAHDRLYLKTDTKTIEKIVVQAHSDQDSGEFVDEEEIGTAGKKIHSVTDNSVKEFGHLFGQMMRTDMKISDNAKNVVNGFWCVRYKKGEYMEDTNSWKALSIGNHKTSAKDYVVVMTSSEYQGWVSGQKESKKNESMLASDYVKDLSIVKGSQVYKTICTKGNNLLTRIFAKLGFNKISDFFDKSKILNKGRSEEGKQIGNIKIAQTKINNIDKDIDKLLKELQGYMTGGKFSLKGYANNISKCIDKMCNKQNDRVTLAEEAGIKKLDAKKIKGAIVKIEKTVLAQEEENVNFIAKIG